jgi:hypothetical protein
MDSMWNMAVTKLDELEQAPDGNWTGVDYDPTRALNELLDEMKFEDRGQDFYENTGMIYFLAVGIDFYENTSII